MRSVACAALLAVFLMAAPSRADFLYEYTTTQPGKTGATVAAEVLISDAAVARGVIRRIDVKSLLIAFTAGGPPFTSLTDDALFNFRSGYAR
jgi:hypothetical protein